MSELFDNLPDSKSPRLLWMEQHGVSVRFRNQPTLGEDQWECWKGAYEERVIKVFGDAETITGEPCDPFESPDFAMAPTLQEVIVKMAERNGWRLWNKKGDG